MAWRGVSLSTPRYSLGYIVSMSNQPVVHWIGAQRDVLHGNIGGRVALADLREHPHLYALGPLEGVRGEVSVFDGAPAISRIAEGQVVVESTFNVRACFLVYASVAG